MPAATRQSRTKAQQREETMAALLAESRRLFASHGYERVNVAEAANRAGVTKGAIYHHFGSKQGLFRAVVRQVHQEVADQIAAATADLDPWSQLVTGCATFVRASTEPQVQQLLLIDAPAVLGWGVWRELDAATSMQLLEDVLTRLVDDGGIARQPVKPLAHLLSGAMNEAALWLAQSETRDRDLEATTAALTGLLDSLRPRSQ